MSLLKNTAVTGYTFGLISSVDSSDVVTGTPVGYYSLEGGAQTPIDDVTPIHLGNGQWSFDLLAAEVDSNIVGLVFTHPSAITVHHTVVTTISVWDEETNSHNIGGSFGKALRQTKEAVVTVEASIDDASATASSFATNLAETSDGHYTNGTMVFIRGSLTGQSRPILGYSGTTKTITLDEAFTEAPANGDSFILTSQYVHSVSEIQAGLATETELQLRTPTAAELAYIVANSATGIGVTFSSGSTTTGVLALVDGTAPSAIDDFYNGRLLVFNSGDLTHLVTDITDYVGTTTTVTVTAIPSSITSSHTARLI